MRRSTVAARTAGLIQSEGLENRRLFAGMPFSDGSHGAFGHHAEAAWRGPGPEVAIIRLPLGGFMHTMTDGTSITAYSSNYSINNLAAPTSAGSTGPAQAVRTVSRSRTPEMVAANGRNATPASAVQSVAMESAPVVQQVLPDTTATDSGSAARDASSLQSNGMPDAASEPVFGPFTLGTIGSDSKQSAPANSPGSLLTLDPDAVDRSLRWQSQDAAYRPKRAASPAAAGEAESLELAARAAMHLQQATLAPVPVELAERPLWQRLATVAAAGLLVVTNTIVRRRQRKAAPAIHR